MKRWLSLIVLLSVAQAVWSDVYSELTIGRGRTIKSNYFGIHFHRLFVPPNENFTSTQWPENTFGSIRLWDSGTNWADLAPRGGVWNFERHDIYISQASRNNASVLYTLGATPRWASARPEEPCPYGFGCGAEPVRMGHWEEYIRRVAQRYGDRIAAYELWNEPHFSDIQRDQGIPGFYTGSAAKMVELARLARKVLDEVSPDAILCTPGFTNGPDRLELFLATGGKQYVQAICYHFYSESIEHFARQILEVRSIMKRHGLEKLPLWNTETGVEVHAVSNPKVGIIARTREETVSLWSQMLILGAAAGLDRFYYYAWDNKISGMVTTNGEHWPGYEAMQRLQSWLLDAQLTGCRSSGAVVRCDAQKGQERFLLAWADKLAKHQIVIPMGWKATVQESLLGETSTLSTKQGLGTASLILSPTPVRLTLEPATRH